MKQTITNDIIKQLPDAEIKIFTNDNKYFNAIIISNVFIGKELIERQQIIYDILGCYLINKSIHALSFKTYSKDEWLNDNRD